MTKPDRIFPVLYSIYFLLLAVAWLSVPDSWRTTVFFVTYFSASIAITIFDALLNRRAASGDKLSE